MKKQLKLWAPVAVAGLLGAGFVAPAQAVGGEPVPSVWIVHQWSDSVTRIDPATNQIVTTIPVGNNPRNAAVSPDGRYVYVPNRDDETVSVIDTLDNTAYTWGSLMLAEPYAITVSPDGERIYIANKKNGVYGSGNDGYIVVSDKDGNQIGYFDDGCMDNPEGIAVSPDGQTLAIASKSGNAICTYDAFTGAEGNMTTQAREPRSVVFSPDGSTIYAGNDGLYYDGFANVYIITAFDFAADDTELFTYNRGRNIAISPDGSQLFVPTMNSYFSIYDTSDGSYVDVSLPGASTTYGATGVYGFEEIYVTAQDSSNVYIYTPSDDTILELSVDSGPSDIVAWPEVAPANSEPEPIDYVGPVVAKLPYTGSAGSNVTLTGLNMKVTEAYIGNTKVSIVGNTATTLTLAIPASQANGTYPIRLVWATGEVTLQLALIVQDEFKVWTQNQLDGTVKMYAKNPMGEGKVQFFHNGREVAWVNAVDATDPKLRKSNNQSYLVRTRTLLAGKNVFEIYVDGVRAWRAAYTK